MSEKRSADSPDVFSRVIYAEFIKALVADLPEISVGRPALGTISAVMSWGADAMPPGYGREFAWQVRRTVGRRFQDADVVEEAMFTVVRTVVHGKFYLPPGSPLYAAQRYVLVATMNAAKNVLRTRWRRQRNEVPLDQDAVDEPQRELADPESLDEQERAVWAADVHATLKRLSEQQPRVYDYVRARLEGKSVATMARDWSLARTSVEAVGRLVAHEIGFIRRERTTQVGAACGGEH